MPISIYVSSVLFYICSVLFHICLVSFSTVYRFCSQKLKSLIGVVRIRLAHFQAARSYEAWQLYLLQSLGNELSSPNLDAVSIDVGDAQNKCASKLSSEHFPLLFYPVDLIDFQVPPRNCFRLHLFHLFIEDLFGWKHCYFHCCFCCFLLA